VPLSETAKLLLAVPAAQLRGAGVRVDMAYGDRGLKGAMRAADRSGARIALVLGDRDIEAGTVGVKDLATGDQVSAPTDSVVAEVLSRLQPS
jgi:histidyl-tRNA synthetase